MLSGVYAGVMSQSFQRQHSRLLILCCTIWNMVTNQKSCLQWLCKEERLRTLAFWVRQWHACHALTPKNAKCRPRETWVNNASNIQKPLADQPSVDTPDRFAICMRPKCTDSGMFFDLVAWWHLTSRCLAWTWSKKSFISIGGKNDGSGRIEDPNPEMPSAAASAAALRSSCS